MAEPRLMSTALRQNGVRSSQNNRKNKGQNGGFLLHRPYKCSRIKAVVKRRSAIKQADRQPCGDLLGGKNQLAGAVLFGEIDLYRRSFAYLSGDHFFGEGVYNQVLDRAFERTGPE